MPLNEVDFISASRAPDRISDLMLQLLEMPPNAEEVAVGRILQVCGVRGFAFLLLILSFLNVVIFMVPFLSFFLGLPMVILAVQMMIGFRAPIFPRAVRRWMIGRDPLIAGVTRAARGLAVMERYIKPRMIALSSPSLMRIHAVFALVMAIMVMLPIPVINVPPSVALIFLAIGLLERDGLFIIAGYTIGIWCVWLFISLGHMAL